MNLRRRSGIGFWLLGMAVAPASAEAFDFAVVGTTFTYTDAQRSFSGMILIPPGAGPFPAIVFDHGQGGTPTGYPNAQVMLGWGAVVIAPTLTHVTGGDFSPAGSGNSPENLARGLAVVDALASLDYVDDDRIALFGHSKGAYAAIGQVSALGARVRVAAMSAGGVVPDSAGVGQAAPTYGEAISVVAPFLMFHGNIDGAVPPQRSVDFAAQLALRGIAHERVEYDVSALDPNQQHNLHQTPAINADMLARTHAWFSAWGLFGVGDALFVDGFEIQGTGGAR
ncbi:MAG: alpha/beta hydrolase family protein [Pseudomonadota bacterium]|jgi:dipeptidyl aminopeptidase/acylaminoacyl peptidase